MRTRTVLQAKRLGIVSCHGDDSLDVIVRRMADEDISALVVTDKEGYLCLLYTSPSPRDRTRSRMPSSA